jgi:hypothetical protein
MTDIILYQAPGPIHFANLAPTERSWLSWGYFLFLLWISFTATRWIIRRIFPTQHVTKADPPVEDDHTLLEFVIRRPPHVAVSKPRSGQSGDICDKEGRSSQHGKARAMTCTASEAEQANLALGLTSPVGSSDKPTFPPEPPKDMHMAE